MSPPDTNPSALETATHDTRTDSGADERPAGARAPCLTILAHPDPTRLGQRAVLSDLLRAGAQVPLSRLEPRFAHPGASRFEPLGVRRLSRRPARLIRAQGGHGLTVDASETTTEVMVDGVEVSGQRSLTKEELEAGATVVLGGRVALLLHLRTLPRTQPPPAMGMVGHSEPLNALRDALRRAAATSFPVLLRGETGTGKELAARALHEHSRRAAGPFRAVDMGTLPATLASSALFGHARSAFSGADRTRKGHLVLAHGGTLFLDEIGESPAEVQAMLLRVLETGRCLPVGSDREIDVDVRVVSATDADLEALVARGAFRAPLLHRLAGVVLELPPLRRRREDVGLLLVHFLRAELAALGAQERLAPTSDEAPWLPAPLVARLARYGWPGNVRELRNAARQIAVFSHDAPRAELGPALERQTRDAEGNEARLDAPRPPRAPGTPGDAAARRAPEAPAADTILAALRAHDWRVAPAARALGIARSTLYDWIERSPQVRKASSLTDDEVRAALVAEGGDRAAAARRLEVSQRGLTLRLRSLSRG